MELPLNQIICGDCLKILPQLPKETIDLIIADPPYNIGVDYKIYKDKKKETEYARWMAGVLNRCQRVLKKYGSIYIINTHRNNAYLHDWIMNRRLCQGRATIFPSEMIFQNWIVWYYPSNIGHSERNFTNSSRSILHISKGNKFKFNNPEGYVIPDVIEFNLVKNTSREKVKGFPNQLPLKLVEFLIEISSNEGDIVLDPFMGSGTTGVACKRHKRNYIGVELNPDFVEIAERRISELL